MCHGIPAIGVIYRARQSELGAVLKTILPQRLIRLRNTHSMSQRALARDAGISRSTIECIESGLAKDVSLRTLLRLCECFDVSVDYLLGFDADPSAIRALLVLAEAPTIRQVREGVSAKCPFCDHLLRPGEVHGVGACIMYGDQKGVSRDRLAAVFGMQLSSVDAVLADEYRSMRRTPKRAPSPVIPITPRDSDDDEPVASGSD